MKTFEYEFVRLGEGWLHAEAGAGETVFESFCR